MKSYPWRWWLALGLLLLSLVVESNLASANCAFGFGGFQCNGWLASHGDTLFLLEIATMLAAAVALLVAVWRSILWWYRQRKAA